MIALMGDAELDEGNIYECLIEGYKHDIRNCWWIVDYNRQSLDSTADRMFRRFDDIFETCGWRVLTLKYGKQQREAFARPGGKSLQEWIDNCPNADFAALTYQGGAAWRARLLADIGSKPHVRKLLDSFDDAALAHLMTNLGGHCVETLLEAFAPPTMKPHDVHRLYHQGVRPAAGGPQGQPFGDDEPAADPATARQPEHCRRPGMGTLWWPGRQPCRRTARLCQSQPVCRHPARARCAGRAGACPPPHPGARSNRPRPRSGGS
jgi:hypothetical protein